MMDLIIVKNSEKYLVRKNDFILLTSSIYEVDDINFDILKLNKITYILLDENLVLIEKQTYQQPINNKVIILALLGMISLYLFFQFLIQFNVYSRYTFMLLGIIFGIVLGVLIFKKKQSPNIPLQGRKVEADKSTLFYEPTHTGIKLKTMKKKQREFTLFILINIVYLIFINFIPIAKTDYFEMIPLIFSLTIFIHFVLTIKFMQLHYKFLLIPQL